MDEDKQTTIEQKESIKLMKMSRGYQWEIKILDIDLTRLELINKEMESKYGIRSDGDSLH